MSGSSSQQQQQTQQSVSQPWQPAIPYLNQQLTQIGNQPLTPTAGQQTAASNLVAGANAIPNLGPSVANTISGYLNPNFTDPYNNPAFSGAMQELLRQTTQGVESSFAGAGRDPSGNAQAPEAIARGFAQGAAPTLANEYNDLLEFQQGGIGSIPSIAQSYLSPGTAQLGANTTQAQLPLANVLSAEGATIPIAGLGGQNFGTGTSNTNTSYPWWAPLSLFSGGGNSAAGNIVGAGKGILGGLGNIFGPNMSWGG